MDLQSGPEIKFAVIARSMTAYSKGEKYAEKCNSAFGCGGFCGFSKFACVCGEQSNADSTFATGALQLSLRLVSSWFNLANLL
jgi:hypothetical protein